MADFCDFLYTQDGLRFKSGSGRVILVIDGTERVQTPSREHARPISSN